MLLLLLQVVVVALLSVLVLLLALPAVLLQLLLLALPVQVVVLLQLVVNWVAGMPLVSVVSVPVSAPGLVVAWLSAPMLRCSGSRGVSRVDRGGYRSLSLRTCCGSVATIASRWRRCRRCCTREGGSPPNDTCRRDVAARSVL
jgi:hypothetical protein